MKRLLGAALAVFLLGSTPTASALGGGDGTRPYGDAATAQVADRIDGTHRVPWLATTLDDGGYAGGRHAEIVKIRSGHGKRYLGIIHVSAGKAAKAREALAGAWCAQRGTRFVLPLRSSTWTSGYPGARYKAAARWAARRLGSGWHLVAP